MIGERLQELRKDAGLSQKDLAEKLCLSHHSISYYERDKSIPTDETKIKIAQLFNVSLDYLLGLIREPFSYNRDENIIILPADFSKEAKADVLKYMEYVKTKYNG